MFSQNVERIVTFVFLRLKSKAVEWRRVLKTLNVIDFCIKNGSPSLVIGMKREIYKISSLCSFTYMENGSDKGNSVREKT